MVKKIVDKNLKKGNIIIRAFKAIFSFFIRLLKAIFSLRFLIFVFINITIVMMGALILFYFRMRYNAYLELLTMVPAETHVFDFKKVYRRYQKKRLGVARTQFLLFQMHPYIEEFYWSEYNERLRLMRTYRLGKIWHRDNIRFWRELYPEEVRSLKETGMWRRENAEFQRRHMDDYNRRMEELAKAVENIPGLPKRGLRIRTKAEVIQQIHRERAAAALARKQEQAAEQLTAQYEQFDRQAREGAVQTQQQSAAEFEQQTREKLDLAKRQAREGYTLDNSSSGLSAEQVAEHAAVVRELFSHKGDIAFIENKLEELKTKQMDHPDLLEITDDIEYLEDELNFIQDQQIYLTNQHFFQLASEVDSEVVSQLASQLASELESFQWGDPIPDVSVIEKQLASQFDYLQHQQGGAIPDISVLERQLASQVASQVASELPQGGPIPNISVLEKQLASALEQQLAGIPEKKTHYTMSDLNLGPEHKGPFYDPERVSMDKPSSRPWISQNPLEQAETRLSRIAEMRGSFNSNLPDDTKKG